MVIYLDNNATTRPHDAVFEAMAPFLRDQYANPSSVHQFGQAVRHQVEVARERVSALIGAKPQEILFTSGGTESINLAIRGALHAMPERRHLLTSAAEHSSVLRVMEQLAGEGYRVDFVGVNEAGLVDAAEWEARISDDTALVSILHVNNETGVINDVPRLAAPARARGAAVHVDAVQSVGKLPIHVGDWPADLVSMAGHKFHGPKGVGALYVRRRTRLEPLIAGGSQERQLRGGTEHVAGIVGMGVAAHMAARSMAEVTPRVEILRDRLEAGVVRSVDYARVNGANAPRIHNTSNISFEALEAEAILILLSEAGVCASSGSACSSGSLEPSHVLKAMGIEPRLARGAIRFSLSEYNRQQEVDQVIEALPSMLGRLAALRQ